VALLSAMAYLTVGAVALAVIVSEFERKWGRRRGGNRPAADATVTMMEFLVVVVVVIVLASARDREGRAVVRLVQDPVLPAEIANPMRQQAGLVKTSAAVAVAPVQE